MRAGSIDFGIRILSGLLVLLSGSAVGHAQDDAEAESPERFILTLEADAMAAVSAPQRDWYLPGAALSVGVFRSLHPKFLVGLRVRGGFLADGPAPQDATLADPGAADLFTGTLALRLRPFGTDDDWARGTGLWLEAGGGAALTGGALRSAIDIGLGYNFSLESVRIGPALRYLQVIQPDDNLEPSDARILAVGVEFVFLDGNTPIRGPAVGELDATPSDRDGDGILDENDACPDAPEDRDDFEDTDGCPDPDNDQDTILDASDSCPLEAEDRDGFEDEDGCPEADNDHDGLLDTLDQCPNEAEVVNGVNDSDGCPDEGLIELIDDRIVLEETVLFDFERSRVKSAARPVIAAINELIRQHPEWMLMRIEGHADARGDQTFNRELSIRRARNVTRALVEAGVPEARLEFVGFGAEHLRDSGTTEESHQRNRRVEFVVARRQESNAGELSSPRQEQPSAVVGPEVTPDASNAPEGDAP